MRTGRKVVTVVCLWLGFAGISRGEASFEFSESPLANWPAGAVLMPTLPKHESKLDNPVVEQKADFLSNTRDLHLPTEKKRYKIPSDWEDFERKFAPTEHEGKPHLTLLENGMYQINETLYAVELFERNVNALLNLEYTLRELKSYDSRSKENEIDDFFDHAKVKTDFDWDAPVSLYIGVRFQIKCDSVFQFWK